MSEKNIAITADELKSLLQTIMAEARKPVVTDADSRRIAEMQENRKASVQQIEEQRKAEEYRQNVLCDHRRHSRGQEGTSRCVYVHNGDFLICQACQKIIRRDEPALWNALLTQESAVQY
jgi:CRISPR/Cas system-associated endonuclease Cas1